MSDRTAAPARLDRVANAMSEWGPRAALASITIYLLADMLIGTGGTEVITRAFAVVGVIYLAVMAAGDIAQKRRPADQGVSA